MVAETTRTTAQVQSMPEAPMIGARVLGRALEREGVDLIFGYPGGVVIPFYDVLPEFDIHHVLVRHEQETAHAADGYARASGKVGVCLATSGPGATNLVTGIATAYMDSIPLVAITGNVALNLIGKDSFQEVDITGITMPITKHNFMVKRVEDLADIVRRAFQIAQQGRPGPVLIDIPKDITVHECEYERRAISPPKIDALVANGAIEEALALIHNAEKPMIYAGGGVIAAEAADELLELAVKINAPVTLSLMGMGAFPATHELYTGMIG